MIIVFDVETTGLDPEKDLVEIAAVTLTEANEMARPAYASSPNRHGR